jgi:hypothetical protein
MDIARYLANYKKLKVGTSEYDDFISKLEALEITGIPLPTQKMPRFTPKYYTAQFIEERQEELGEEVLKAYLAVAIQVLILKRKAETPQFEVIEGSIVDEYLKTLESEFDPIEDKTLNKLLSELTRKPRKSSESIEEEDTIPELDAPKKPR